MKSAKYKNLHTDSVSKWYKVLRTLPNGLVELEMPQAPNKRAFVESSAIEESSEEDKTTDTTTTNKGVSLLEHLKQLSTSELIELQKKLSVTRADFSILRREAREVKEKVKEPKQPSSGKTQIPKSIWDSLTNEDKAPYQVLIDKGELEIGS